MAWTVKAYIEENETISPVEKFLSTLPVQLRKKAIWTIDLLEEFGTDLPMPYARAIQGERYRGLWELRVKQSTDIVRIFYFTSVGRTFVLLHGFTKKSGKTPESELETARKRMDDYRRRVLHK